MSSNYRSHIILVLPIEMHLTAHYLFSPGHFCKASDRRKLERIQERGLRAVIKIKHSSYEKLPSNADIPSLYNRRLQDIAVFMHVYYSHRDFVIFSNYTVARIT